MAPQPWDGNERRKVEHEELVKAVVCAIREEAVIGAIPPEQHAAQHAFLAEWIAEIKAKRERREKLKTQVAGWAIVTFLGSVGTGAYKLWGIVQEHWK